MVSFSCVVCTGIGRKHVKVLLILFSIQIVVADFAGSSSSVVVGWGVKSCSVLPEIVHKTSKIPLCAMACLV
jgi:hypothetical protein